MIRVREYSCNSCGKVTEVFASEHHDAIPCPKCGGEARKLMSAPRFALDGTTGDFPGAAMAWERKRAEKMAVEQQKQRDHGDDGWT